MLSRSVADQAGAAKQAPRPRVHRWSSSRQPKTRPSAASSFYEGLSARSPKFGAGNRHIASDSVSAIHKRHGFRIEDIQNHPASGRPPSIFDKPLRWRTATEIRAKFLETSGESPHYTTPWGLLKQPDKLQPASRRVESPHYVVAAQKKAGKNAKIREETKTLSHFSKSDIRYWSDVSSAKVIRGTGIADIPGSGVQGCSYGGRRGFFSLQTSNKAAASAKARDIYICLAANGWEAPLAR